MPKNELRLPIGVVSGGQKADEAFEIMRVWWVGDHPEFVLKPAFRDPENIGRMLDEAAQHFSQVHASEGDGDAEEILKGIRAGWAKASENRVATQMSKETKPKAPKA